MKRAPKFTALILIASMIFCMITPLVHAEEAPSGEENNKFSIAIKNSNNSHKFKAYQIFKGRVDKVEHRLSDIDWGKNIDAKDQSTEPKTGDKKSLIETLKEDDVLKNDFSSVSNARSVAKALDGIKDDSEKAIRFAEIVSNYLKEEGVTELKYDESSKTHKADNLDGGYYLIMDSDTIPNNESSTRYILQLSQDQEVEVKSGTTSVEKYVRRADTNDEFKKAVSAEMGGTVEFQLIGTLPDNYDYYSKYYYSFIDTLPNGLDYVEGSVTVKVYGKKLTVEEPSSDEYQEIPIDDFKAEVTEEGQTIKFTIDDLKKYDKNTEEGQDPKITKDSKIVLTFKAKVNQDVVIGSTGNINKVKLEYSSNPNKGHEEEKTKTTEDEAAVYTYELEIEKQDKDQEEAKKLEGVGFKLYKKVEQDDGSEKRLYAKSSGSNITEWTETKSDATEFVTQTGGITNIKGLSSGTYYLTETKFLPRYDSIGDIEIIINEVFGEDKENASPTATVQDKEKLESLTFSIEEKKDDGTTNSEDKMVGSKETSGNIQNGKISIIIYNKKGSLLPKTGGIGTIIFYVLGISLILFAVYLIISKRKKDK